MYARTCIARSRRGQVYEHYCPPERQPATTRLAVAALTRAADELFHACNFAQVPQAAAPGGGVAAFAGVARAVGAGGAAADEDEARAAGAAATATAEPDWAALASDDLCRRHAWLVVSLLFLGSHLPPGPPML